MEIVWFRTSRTRLSHIVHDVRWVWCADAADIINCGIFCTVRDYFRYSLCFCTGPVCFLYKYTKKENNHNFTNKCSQFYIYFILPVVLPWNHFVRIPLKCVWNSVDCSPFVNGSAKLCFESIFRMSTIPALKCSLQKW